MAVIKTVIDGDCTIRFHDDYITHDEKEIQAILDKVARIYLENLPPEKLYVQQQSE